MGAIGVQDQSVVSLGGSHAATDGIAFPPSILHDNAQPGYIQLGNSNSIIRGPTIHQEDFGDLGQIWEQRQDKGKVLCLVERWNNKGDR